MNRGLDNLDAEPTRKPAARRRLQVSLRAALVLVTVLASACWYYREPLREAFGVTEPTTMHLIRSEADLKAARSAGRGVIFIHVDWSVTSMIARQRLETTIAAWSRRNDPHPVGFYLLDATWFQENGTPTYIKEWLSGNESLQRAVTAGAGEVVWIRDGEILKSQSGATLSPEQLFETTRTLLRPPE